MISITMTAEQTEIYDNGSDKEQADLMRALRLQAEQMGGNVEIYTADGILADVVE